MLGGRFRSRGEHSVGMQYLLHNSLLNNQMNRTNVFVQLLYFRCVFMVISCHLLTTSAVLSLELYLTLVAR